MLVEDIEPQSRLRAANIRSLVTVLQAIKPANTKQECLLLIGPEDGLTVRLEDDSKGLQSAVFVRPDLWMSVDCPGGRAMFGVQFSLLLDTLQVFASLPGQDVELRYPGPNSELIIEMADDTDSNTCTYARISTMEAPALGELMDHWLDPASHFILHGALLKEAIDDLEWASAGSHQASRGNVALIIHDAEPRAFILRASGAGSLEVDFPTDSENMHTFHVADPDREVACVYKNRHLRAAFCNIPHTQKDPASVSTKIQIDCQGLMKVMHMISIPGAGVGSNMQESQGFSGDRKCSVQFMIVPEDEAVEET